MTPKEKDRIGWASPHFTETRSVKLSPKLLARNRCVSAFPARTEGEVYKVLRTQILQRMRRGGGNTVMVTSAHPGEGKTLTAINLSLTVAKEFQQTALLVDCDLRCQDVHRYLGIDNERSLVDYLVDDMPVRDILVWPEIEKLTFISGARTIQDSSELLGSPRMQDLVTEMKNRYPDRYVFFDVPPVLSSADALTFSPFVDHILMVVKAGETSMQDVKKALSFFPPEKVLGLVLNRKNDEKVPAYGQKV